MKPKQFYWTDSSGTTPATNAECVALSYLFIDSIKKKPNEFKWFDSKKAFFYKKIGSDFNKTKVVTKL